MCQMNDDRKVFAKEWESLAKHVEKEHSDLVLLPEMPFSTWFCASPKFEARVWNAAVSEHQWWTGRLAELGSKVVLATRPVDKGKRRLNEGFVWTRGRARGVHFKSYLPNEAGYFEASWYDRGERKFTPVRTGGSVLGFMICTDLWSMPHARAYGKEGVHLIAVPRATEKATVEKWLAGGKTAAVVSGAFCISSNRVGRRGEARFGGCGWVVGPDGQQLGLTSSERPFVTVDVDLKDAERAKRTYPRVSLEPD